MTTSLLARLALGAVAAVALAGGPSTAPTAQSVPDRAPVTVEVAAGVAAQR